MNKKDFKLNIQLFAEPGGTDENKESAGSTVSLEDVLNNKELVEGFLKSDIVAKLVQSEVDKVRTKSTQEKAKQLSEFEAYKLETTVKLQELQEFQTRYFRTEALKESGLDIELWEYVKGSTKEEILKSAEGLKQLISKKVETKAGFTPDSGNNGDKFKGITKEQFGKMSYTERAELFQKNKDLYLELIK